MATSWPYENRNARNVVSDDERDFDRSWHNHLYAPGVTDARRAAGTVGGIDLAFPEGTKVYADAAGVVKKTYLSQGSSAGRVVKVTMANGWADEYMHLSAFAAGAGDGMTVKQGQLVGYSGGSGYGEDDHYQPHLHRHRVGPDKRRYNPAYYWGGDGVKVNRAKPGKIEYTLETGDPNVTFYRRLQWWSNMRTGTYPYAYDGVMLYPAWLTVAKALIASGIDVALPGIWDAAWPSPSVLGGLQQLAKRGGYTGPVDNDPGEYTYRGLSTYLNTL